jgi:zinc protease
VFAQIERVQSQGVLPATLEKVKETQRRSHETSLEQNGYWLGLLLSSAQSGEEPASYLEYPALVDALTADALRAAAASYLRRENYVRVSLYPERGER